MPFAEFFPRPFIPASIQTFAPAASGVYGISNAAEWIYIGETEDIRDALLTHSQERDTALMKRAPTGFVFEMCDRAHRTARQDRLVLEYEPRCNRHSSSTRYA